MVLQRLLTLHHNILEGLFQVCSYSTLLLFHPAFQEYGLFLGMNLLVRGIGSLPMP